MRMTRAFSESRTWQGPASVDLPSMAGHSVSLGAGSGVQDTSAVRYCRVSVGRDSDSWPPVCQLRNAMPLQSQAFGQGTRSVGCCSVVPRVCSSSKKRRGGRKP